MCHFPSLYHLLPFPFTHGHVLHLLSFFVTRYHSLSLDVIRFTTHCHLLPLVPLGVTWWTTRLSFFKQSTLQAFYKKAVFPKGIKREAGTSFVLLCQSRNTNGRLMKTYLHRPIEIFYFLPARDFKNISHNFKIFLCFQKYTTCKMSRANNIRFILVCIIVPWFIVSKYHAQKVLCSIHFVRKVSGILILNLIFQVEK